MGEVTSLRKENDELKKQLQEIHKDLSNVKKRVTAPSRKQHGAESQNLQTLFVMTSCFKSVFINRCLFNSNHVNCCTTVCAMNS